MKSDKTESENKGTILFEAVPVELERPPHTQVLQVLIAGRIPMLAMLFPNGKWMTMGMAQSKEITQVTHWLKLKPALPLDNDDWISVKDQEPEYGDEVLCFNENWIDEDFNPKGIRIGFLNGEGVFTTAHWWDYQDTYMTIDKSMMEGSETFSDHIKNNTEPTHWHPIPIFSEQSPSTCKESQGDIAELVELLKFSRRTISALKGSLMAHPDHEDGSEFDDRTTMAQECEYELTDAIQRFTPK